MHDLLVDAEFKGKPRKDDWEGWLVTIVVTLFDDRSASCLTGEITRKVAALTRGSHSTWRADGVEVSAEVIAFRQAGATDIFYVGQAVCEGIARLDTVDSVTWTVKPRPKKGDQQTSS